MDDQFLERIAAEVAACTDVSNLHGITSANLRSHLVVPPRRGRFSWELVDARGEDWMWVVVDERPGSGDGYLVVYDRNRDEFLPGAQGDSVERGFRRRLVRQPARRARRDVTLSSEVSAC